MIFWNWYPLFNRPHSVQPAPVTLNCLTFICNRFYATCHLGIHAGDGKSGRIEFSPGFNLNFKQILTRIQFALEAEACLGLMQTGGCPMDTSLHWTRLWKKATQMSEKYNLLWKADKPWRNTIYDHKTRLMLKGCVRNTMYNWRYQASFARLLILYIGPN